MELCHWQIYGLFLSADRVLSRELAAGTRQGWLGSSPFSHRFNNREKRMRTKSLVAVTFGLAMCQNAVAQSPEYMMWPAFVRSNGSPYMGSKGGMVEPLASGSAAKVELSRYEQDHAVVRDRRSRFLRLQPSRQPGIDDVRRSPLRR